MISITCCFAVVNFKTFSIEHCWRDVSEPIFKRTIRPFLFETLSDRDDYVEADTVIQFLNS